VDEVEKIDFEVFNKRAKTSTFRRVRGVLIAYNRALKAR
jgi:phytoene synthase